MVEKYQVQSTGIRNFQFEYLDDFARCLIMTNKKNANVFDALIWLQQSNVRRIEILEESAKALCKDVRATGTPVMRMTRWLIQNSTNTQRLK